MRILHALRTVDPAYGGPTEGVRQMGFIIGSKLGATVEIASLDDPAEPYVQAFPLRVHALGPSKGSFGYSPRFTKWLDQHLKDYDLVVINGIWSYNLLGAYRALRHTKKPYVVFTHGMLDPYFNQSSRLKRAKKSIYWQLYLRDALRNASAVLFTCEEERVLARQSFKGYQCTERVIAYGTADPEFDLEACRSSFLAQYPQLVGKRVILFLSRINPKKGIDLLIRAAAANRANHPDVVYVIAGPDSAGIQASLVELSQSLGVADQIIWPGMLTGAEKWGAFASAEAFILPSHQENFGIVIAEALACGKPVLTTKKVNIWHEVEEYGAGIIADDDAKGVQDMLSCWLSKSDKERSSFSVNARKCFERKFEAHESAKSILEVYRSVAS